MAKINPIQVVIIGVVLSIIAAVVIYFTLIKPTEETIAASQARYEAADLTANKMPAAKTERKKAEAEVALAQADFNKYDRQYMPNINVSNLLTGTQQLWNEQVRVLGPKVEKYLQADQSVRVVSSAITIPAPSSNPNAVNQKSFTYDLGQVSVTGTFTNILRHVERWNKFDRLVLVDGLTLTGNSPRLVGTYSLRCFEFTKGEKAGEAIPQAAPGTGGGGGGALSGGGDPGIDGGGPPPDINGGPPPDGSGSPPPG